MYSIFFKNVKINSSYKTFAGMIGCAGNLPLLSHLTSYTLHLTSYIKDEDDGDGGMRSVKHSQFCIEAPKQLLQISAPKPLLLIEAPSYIFDEK